MTAFIPSPSANGFYIGPLFVHAYGLAYVFAVLAAILVTSRRWEALGGHRELVYEVAMWGFPAGLIGGRIYFLITTPSQIPPHWWGPFAVWKGGLGIWGGIAAGVAAGLWVLHRRLEKPDVLPVHGLRRAGATRRAVVRTDRQLLQPGAVRQADDAPVGTGDLPGPPPARLPPVRDVPAHVPVRDHLEPVARGLPRVAGPYAKGPRPRSVRAVRRRLLRRSGCSRRPSGSTTRTTSWGCA